MVNERRKQVIFIIIREFEMKTRDTTNHPLGQLKTKTLKHQILPNKWSSNNSHLLLRGMQSNVAILGDRIAVPYTLWRRVLIVQYNPSSWYFKSFHLYSNSQLSPPHSILHLSHYFCTETFFTVVPTQEKDRQYWRPLIGWIRLSKTSLLVFKRSNNCIFWALLNFVFSNYVLLRNKI